MPFAAREPNETEVRRVAGGLYLGRIPCGAAVLQEEVFSRFLCQLLPPPLNPLQPGEEEGRISSRRGRKKAESPPAGGVKIR
jgi:hypothetical protein